MLVSGSAQKTQRLPGRFDTAVLEEVSARAFAVWELAEANPGIPLFSGGLLDSWPSYAVDALRIVRDEAAVVRSLQLHEQRKKKG